MAGTKVESLLLTNGQNEGVERAVLPAPQLEYVLNARLRKSSRWGKRYGSSALSVTNLSASPGQARAVGGGKVDALTCFALVDSRCSVYNQTASAFVAAPAVSASNSREPGAASGWLPDASFFPVPPESLKNQTGTHCATCYASGYLYSVIEYSEPTGGGDTKLRVAATDPNDQTVVRVDTFVASTAAFGGIKYPRIVLVGSTLILTYLSLRAGAADVMARSLTAVSSSWSAETVLATRGAAFAYDAAPYSSTNFLLVVASAGGSGVQLRSTAFGLTANQVLADVSGNPLTECSVAGSSAVASGEIYVGYACAATPSAKVIVFTANLAGVVGTGTISAIATRPLLALLPAGNVRAVYDYAVAAGGYGIFRFRDVTTAAAVGANVLTQTGAVPISIPFAVGSEVYVWTEIHLSTTGGGLPPTGPNYATLLRLVDPAATLGGNFSCPLEMSVQDYVVSPGQGLGITDSRGLPAVARIGVSGATYAAMVPILYSLGTVTQANDFRILQAKHYTDNSARSSVNALYADSSSFLPLGTLTRVDDRGAVEEGFVHPPVIVSVTPAAGAGTLTPSSDYYYSAVYKSRNSNGRFEVSAPTTPTKVTMAAGQNQNTVVVLGLGISQRSSVVVELYRTLSNGQTFYLVAILDSTLPTVTYLDQSSDTQVAQQQALYTQVGQTLPNAFPPPSRFGCVGGQRVFLGGQIRPDIVQGSKLIVGDQSPTFADGDAFRIVLPGPCTGAAWVDTLCMFTAEGIYIVSGDGPDDSGVGDFGTLTRMPYELGCVEPRSVVVVDDGCFFQTSRGIYLLPRGFGTPVPAGDNVMKSLESYPIITGVAVVTKKQEQSVLWTATVAGSTTGIRIVYDLAHKAWSIDSVADSFGAAVGPCGIGQWVGGEAVHLTPAVATNGLQVSNGIYSDAGGFAYQMTLRTGDLRPFGVLSEGAIIKAQCLAELRSFSTLVVTKTTEWGVQAASRTFSLAAGDYQIGNLTVTDIELGAAEARESVKLSIELSETSTNEGLAFIALSLEHEQGEGLKRATPLSRVT